MTLKELGVHPHAAALEHARYRRAHRQGRPGTQAERSLSDAV